MTFQGLAQFGQPLAILVSGGSPLVINESEASGFLPASLSYRRSSVGFSTKLGSVTSKSLL